MKYRGLTCVDLFAGAGGFSLAATRQKIKIALAVEYDVHAAETYRGYFSKHEQSSHLLEQNIRNVSLGDLKSIVQSRSKKCDIVLGGPPCQGFSGHRLGDSGVNDTRNSLIHIYFDIVEALNPSIFVLENVPGMLWKRHEDYLRDFYQRGKESGYELQEPVVLDARNYGVAQGRKRVFILGIKKGAGIDTHAWPPKSTHCEKPEPNSELKPWRSCAEAFAPAHRGDPNDIHMKHGEILTNVFAKTPPNGGSRKDSGRVLPCHKDHQGHRDVYGRINSFKPAPTMTTACINPSKGRFVHPTKNHGITLREAARIQGFPDDFVFTGGLTAGGRQVGNAVPILLGEAVLKAVKKMLKTETFIQVDDLEKASV